MKRIYQLVFISIIILIGILIYYKQNCSCDNSDKKSSTIPPAKTDKVIVTEDGKTLYDNSFSEKEMNKKIEKVINSENEEIKKLRQKGREEIKKIIKQEKDLEKIIKAKKEEKLKKIKEEHKKRQAEIKNKKES